jgi:hypothetical protein
MYVCAYTSQMSGIHQMSGCARVDTAGATHEWLSWKLEDTAGAGTGARKDMVGATGECWHSNRCGGGDTRAVALKRHGGSDGQALALE